MIRENNRLYYEKDGGKNENKNYCKCCIVRCELHFGEDCGEGISFHGNLGDGFTEKSLIKA